MCLERMSRLERKAREFHKTRSLTSIFTTTEMSTVIDDHYEFNSLGEWELFYRRHKDAIDRKTTKWLNNHISIHDGDRRYRIFYRRHKLYLKPFKQLDTAKEKESIQEHQLSLVLEKLDELFIYIDSISSPQRQTTHSGEHVETIAASSGRPSGTDTRDIPLRLPNKSVIERVKEVKPHQDESTKRQTAQADTTTRHLVSRLRSVSSTR